jgi:hypothetical protein
MMALTQDTVREDYLLKDEWTFHEAGLYAAERSVATIYRWSRVPVTFTVDGHTVKQMRFDKSKEVGADCVPASAFRTFIRTGRPQGRRV